MKARAECSAVVVLDESSPALGATVDMGGFTARSGSAVYHALITMNGDGLAPVPCSENYISIMHIQNMSEASDLTVYLYDITDTQRTLLIAPMGVAVVCGVIPHTGLFSGVNAAILENTTGETARVFMVGSDTWQVDATTTKGEETD